MSADQHSFIRFVQSCPAALDCGEYKIQIEQQVQSPAQETFQKDAHFTVQGSRFRLEPTDLYATYPPANHEGNFGNCLPHIILTRKTLPWERSLDGEAVSRATEQGEMLELSPWMALIVLHEGDLSDGWSLEGQSAKVQDVLNPPEGVFHPSLQLEIGQMSDDACKIIDLPVHLFQMLLPKRSEMALLCHIRVVDEQAAGEQQSERWLATVISNRFPQVSREGVKNVAHLVSLEGFQDYLPDGGTEFPTGIRTVRLVSLTDWSFVGTEESYSFGDLAQQLTVDRLHLPVSKAAENPAEQMIEAMFQQGYTAQPHLFRHGEKTVSWYRGPLVPLQLAERVVDSIPCADHALRYDPTMGLFDISYAAAWQMGRLLALQNQHFAAEMVRFRKENHQMIRTLQNRQQIHRKLQSFANRQDRDEGGIAATAYEDDFYHVFLQYLSGDFLDQLVGENDAAEPLLGPLADPTGLLKHVDKHHGLISREMLTSMVHTGEEVAKQLLHHLLHRKED